MTPQLIVSHSKKVVFLIIFIIFTCLSNHTELFQEFKAELNLSTNIAVISSIIINIAVTCFQSRQKYYKRLDKQVQFTGLYVNTKESEVKLVFLSVIMNDALFLVIFFCSWKDKNNFHETTRLYKNLQFSFCQYKITLSFISVHQQNQRYLHGLSTVLRFLHSISWFQFFKQFLIIKFWIRTSP